MRIAVEAPCSAEILMAMLEGLVGVNQILLQRSELPPLYRAGVRYRRELGTENWKNCEQVYRGRGGDCEDLASWRVAELRQAGELGAYVRVIRASERLWHVLAIRESGDIEDPSALLGMKGGA